MQSVRRLSVRPSLLTNYYNVTIISPTRVYIYILVVTWTCTRRRAGLSEAVHLAIHHRAGNDLNNHRLRVTRVYTHIGTIILYTLTTEYRFCLCITNTRQWWKSVYNTPLDSFRGSCRTTRAAYTTTTTTTLQTPPSALLYTLTVNLRYVLLSYSNICYVIISCYSLCLPPTINRRRYDLYLTIDAAAAAWSRIFKRICVRLITIGAAARVG